MMASPYIVGIGSGIVAAVLFASLATNTALAMLLFYVTPLPLLLARLGWGRAAGQLGFVTAVVLVGVILNLRTALLYGVTLGLPALLLGHLALLSRGLTPEDPEGRPLAAMPPVVEWYPPGRIIAWTAVMAGALASVGLLLVSGGSDEAYNRGVRDIFQQVILPQFQEAGVPLDALRMERYVAMVSRLVLPAVLAVVWMLVMLVNLWLAAKSAAISGQLARPWPAFATLEFPPMMTLGFLAAVGAALMPGMPGIMAMAFLGAFGLAYLLLGLVVLHQLIPDSPLKPVLLVGIYLSMVLIDWVTLVVALVGLAEPLLELRRRALRRSAPPPKGGES